MRLFFGLSLPDDVRAVTASCAAQAQMCISGRYTLPENHHMTLAFLGEVPAERLMDARDVLARCTEDFPAPKLMLSGFSHFGRKENGILILRVKSEPELDALHDRLVRALCENGLPADRGPFSPHITLARHADVTMGYPVCPHMAFEAGQAHVFLSARDEENILRYTPLYTVSFRKQDA